MIVPAGNDSENTCLYSPTRVPQAGVVGVSSPANDTVFEWSASGACLDLYAPADDIALAWNHNDTDVRFHAEGATSWAAPLVAGAMALQLEAHPGWSPAQVRQAILDDALKGVLQKVPRATKDYLLHIPV